MCKQGQLCPLKAKLFIKQDKGIWRKGKLIEKNELSVVLKIEIGISLTLQTDRLKHL